MEPVKTKKAEARVLLITLRSLLKRRELCEKSVAFRKIYG